MVCMMIVPEALADAANAAAQQIDSTSEGEAFSLRLRTIGSTAATHRYSGPNLVDESVITAIRQLVQSTGFANAGIYHECGPENVRAEFLQLLAANGLEEMPTSEVGE